jgi:hypothetical protein
VPENFLREMKRPKTTATMRSTKQERNLDEPHHAEPRAGGVVLWANTRHVQKSKLTWRRENRTGWQISRPRGKTKLLQDKCSLRKIKTETRRWAQKKNLEQQKRWQQPLQTGNRNSKRDTANLTGAHSERKASSQKDKDPVHWNTAP